jgi:hypothetical protein
MLLLVLHAILYAQCFIREGGTLFPNPVIVLKTTLISLNSEEKSLGFVTATDRKNPESQLENV